MVADTPAITVIIATYNWSRALRCAIRSVLLQTRQDFELLVVGDGCTDDSEAVVAAFNDDRIRWHNLDRNFGSQWAANDHGIGQARADWIAYLGHDDIWYPTHLEAVLRTARDHGADVVTSTMILYWPEAARGRSIAGIFGSESFGPGDFVPPSAVAHARAVYGGSVAWRDPGSAFAPNDVDFVTALAAARCRFAATNELTCFKFNAAWRRDAYRTRAVDEQERMLALIDCGSDFRHRELHDVVQAVVSGRFAHVVVPPDTGIQRGEYVERNRRNKGVVRRFDTADQFVIEAPICFDMTEQAMPFEWHALERGDRGSFRWSGPSRIVTIDLPVSVDRELVIRVYVLMAIDPVVLERLTVFVHGKRLHRTICRSGSGYIVECIVRPADVDRQRDFGLTLDTAKVARPCDVGLGQDGRWMGIAVAGVVVEPLNVGRGG